MGLPFVAFMSTLCRVDLISGRSFVRLMFCLLTYHGAVVKRRQEKGRWTKGRRRHKVDRAIIRQKGDDKRSTGLATMTKGRQG